MAVSKNVIVMPTPIPMEYPAVDGAIVYKSK